MEKIIAIVKKESIFFIALILAIISCFFKTPSLSYINWETIIILIILMFFVQTLQELGIFDIIIKKLLSYTHTIRSLLFILIFSCFFASMIITNDIAVLLLVPLTISTLKKINMENLIIITVSLQAIAANMGSMIIPIGSPHNIILYTASNVSFINFMKILLPYFIISFIFLLIICFLIPSKKIEKNISFNSKINKNYSIKNILYKIDYFLLLTFIALFILIGNLQQIEFFSTICKEIIIGNEMILGILFSQVLTNIPASILLTGFSQNYTDIIIGINIGGLGTLIASFCNLIAYKIYVNEYNNKKGKFLLIFSLLNVILMAILLLFYYMSVG